MQRYVIVMIIIIITMKIKSNNNSKNNSNKDNDNNVCTVALYAFRVKSQSTRHALDVLMVWMGWPLFLAS